jgi:Tol biopolymer transport system component
MVAGKAPFVGATTTDLLAAILFHEPPSLLLYRGDLPEELARIASKTLVKDRDERYQTAEDLLTDLRRLRQRLEVEAEIERLATPDSGAELAVTTDGTQAVVPATDESSERTDEGAARPTSSAEYVVGEIRRHKLGTLIALTIILLAVGGIGFRLYKLFTHQELKPAPFQTTKITRLTNSGNVTAAAISSDGKYVAYVLNESRRNGIHVKQVETLSDVEIVSPEVSDYWGPTFSPDGNYLLYVKSTSGDNGDLYQVPTLGGTPRKLLANTGGLISLSPDGKRVTFLRLKERECGLIVANVDGTGIETFATRQEPDCYGYSGPAWSPDGKVIAYPVRHISETQLEGMGVVAVDVEHKAEIMPSSKKWVSIGRLAWLSDGSGLMLTASEGDEDQVWLLDYPGGKVRRLTTDLNIYDSLTLSADSNTLAAVQTEQRNNLWLAPGNDATRARQLTPGAGKYEVLWNISWTPDGKILYSSKAGGNLDIWIMDADGRNQRQLTVDTNQDFSPFATPDGSHIVFVTARDGNYHLWQMEIDGSNQKQLTSGPADTNPRVTPDGKWVVYQKWASGNLHIYKVPIEGGTPVPLTDKGSEAPAVSPDGRLVACIYWSNPESQPPQFALLPIEGGPPVKLIEIPPTLSEFRIQWTPDGSALAYVDTRGGVSNIWRLPIDGRPPTQLTDFKSDQIFRFAWSRDGKQLALVRGSVSNDVVLIHDLRIQQ